MRLFLTCVVAMWAALALPTYAANDSSQTVVGLISAGHYQDARLLADKNLKGTSDETADRLFVEGLILVARHQDKAAVEVFQAILKVRPQNEPARVELAKALFRVGRTNEARLAFDELVKRSRDPAERSAFSRYSELAANSLAANKLFQYDYYLSLSPSTNFNKASGHRTYTVGTTTFDIDDKSRAKAGIGLNFGGTATYLQPVGGDHIEYQAGFDGTKYADKSNDDYTARFSTRYIKDWGTFKLAIGPYVDYRWIDYNPYSLRFGGQADMLARLNPQTDLFFSGAILKQNYQDDTYLNGWRGLTNIIARRQIGQSAYVSVGTGAVYENTRAAYLTHTDGRIFAEVGKHFDNGVFLAVSPIYEHHRYDADFPGFGAARKDEVAAVAVTMSYDKFAYRGYIPQITYRYTKQFSNVSFYDYDSHDLSIGFRKTF